MRVVILGGTLFIGRRIARELLARGDDVMVVHGARRASRAFRLRACARRTLRAGRGGRPAAGLPARRGNRYAGDEAADADAVLPHLPDAHLVLLSSIDVYRADELLLAGQGGEPVPLTEQSPGRSERYPPRDLLPGLGEHYDKLDVEPLYLSRGGLRAALDDLRRTRRAATGGVRAAEGSGRAAPIPFGAGTSLDTAPRGRRGHGRAGRAGPPLGRFGPGVQRR